MDKKIITKDFNVKKLTAEICEIVEMWKIARIDLNSYIWDIYLHNNEIYCSYIFKIDFNDINSRIKLEDLRLNVIHFIEELKDDTSYNYYLQE